MIKCASLFCLILLSSFANANDFILRTQSTDFYQLSAQQLQENNLNQKNGALSITGQAGKAPYFYNSKNHKFKNNDGVVFFSEMLHGKEAYQHPLDDFNGYTLSEKNKNKDWKKWQHNANDFKKLPVCENIRTTDHYEHNKLLIRINAQEYKKAPELWYWKKLTQLNKKGFSVPLDLLDRENNKNIQLKAVFRSTNVDRIAKDIAHHEVQIQLNGKTFKTLNWDKRTEYRSDNINIPADLIKEKDNVLTFLVPKRKKDKKTIIDIVMLDFFEISYNVQASKITASDVLSSEKSCRVKLNDKQIAFAKSTQKYGFDYIALNPNSQVFIGNMDKLKTVKIKAKNTIENDLAKIDYLMITHPLFAQSLEPLAQFYRDKGQNVAVVDIDHVYQNYSHGIRELYAIKNLINDVFEQGQGRLQHVLLVGDSSWDWRDYGQNNQYAKWSRRVIGGNRNFTNFPHQKSYTEKKIDRNFVPTGQYHSSEGHSASDNWFVSIVDEVNIKGTDYIPDVAIGRFPASTAQELDAMIAKTINYSKNSQVGPWKSRVLWITNAQKRFQNSSKRTSKHIGKYGVMAEEIFPQEMDGDNLKVQETLTDSINSGDLIVHFLGHGGKSIWRIGPPDLKKNRDLFTLDHISGLQNSKQLPFVMSMSCYSAPFDHPFADSIGEKFIREPEVGAVAVLAASWRNSPNSTFSRYIIENIFDNPQNSIGQAILAGKRKFRGRTMVEMYNLLGDPALHLAIPTLTMTTEKLDNKIKVAIDSKKFKGKAKIEILDDKAEIISSNLQDIYEPSFLISLKPDEIDCFQGRIYAWDSAQNIDAMTSFDCKKPVTAKQKQKMKEDREKEEKLEEKIKKSKQVVKEKK